MKGFVPSSKKNNKSRTAQHSQQKLKVVKTWFFYRNGLLYNLGFVHAQSQNNNDDHGDDDDNAYGQTDMFSKEINT